MDSSLKRKIKSNDGKIFELEEKCLKMSKVLTDLVKDFPETDAELPTNEVDGKNLEKIIEFLKHYETEKPKEIQKPLPSGDLKQILEKWDYDYIISLTLEECIELINAANYLDIPDLVNLASIRIASEMINCSVEEARAKFNILPDMTEEEMKEYEKYPLD